MERMRRSASSGTVILLVFVCVWFANGRITFAQSDETIVAAYHPTPTLTIESSSPSWGTQDRLKEIYQELLRNKHGKELDLLQKIHIYDSYPQGTGEAGEYHFISTVDLFGRVQMKPGQIDIYGGHDRKTIPSIARTLSHEYGHHVTHYYTILSDGISLTDTDRWQETTFARLRGLGQNDKVGLGDKPHRWQVPEIAAEDYVQLFGSPNAKIPTQFPSRYTQALEGNPVKSLHWDGMMYNISPQENFDLPLAAEVPGEYAWLNSGLESGTPKLNTSYNLSQETIELRVKSVVNLGKGGYQVNLSWQRQNMAAVQGSIDTLITWRDGDDLPEPIVTKKPSEPLDAVYGSFMITKPTETLLYKDPNAAGVHHFMVYEISDRGFAYQSNQLTLDMNHPDQATSQTVRVVPSRIDHSSFPVLNKQASSGSIAALLALWLQKLTGFLEQIFQLFQSLLNTSR